MSVFGFSHRPPVQPRDFSPADRAQYQPAPSARCMDNFRGGNRGGFGSSSGFGQVQSGFSPQETSTMGPRSGFGPGQSGAVQFGGSGQQSQVQFQSGFQSSPVSGFTSIAPNPPANGNFSAFGPSPASNAPETRSFIPPSTASLSAPTRGFAMKPPTIHSSRFSEQPQAAPPISSDSSDRREINPALTQAPTKRQVMFSPDSEIPASEESVYKRRCFHLGEVPLTAPSESLCALQEAQLSP